ncbi:MAG: phosphoribosyltransferase family protein [bacterium]
MAPSVSFSNDDNITYRFVDWEEWGSLSYKLAKLILAGEKPFDRIIALATGGLTLSRAMKDYLGISKLSSLHISFYDGIASTTKTPIISQSVSTNIEGERVLIFDDINDSGETMKVAKAYLTMHGPKEIVTSSILEKPHTKTPSDYHVLNSTEWIIFPDEIRETITFLYKKWSKQKLSLPSIKSRLMKIGFTNQHLALILDAVK